MEILFILLCCAFISWRSNSLSVKQVSQPIRLQQALQQNIATTDAMMSKYINFGSTSLLCNKTVGLPFIEIARCILSDWKGKSSSGTEGKGYYITGMLTKSIYRDDCFFDGPDPDMPVRGLKKYLLSASNLFDRKHSRADIIRPVVLTQSDSGRTIQVFWRLEGVLNLPWHPHMKPWTGNTVYHLDKDGLVERHVEQWDISVLDAFVSTLLPGLEFGAPPALPPPSGWEQFLNLPDQPSPSPPSLY